jgi:hypothetical protein
MPRRMWVEGGHKDMLQDDNYFVSRGEAGRGSKDFKGNFRGNIENNINKLVIITYVCNIFSIPVISAIHNKGFEVYTSKPLFIAHLFTC